MTCRCEVPRPASVYGLTRDLRGRLNSFRPGECEYCCLPIAREPHEGAKNE